MLTKVAGGVQREATYPPIRPELTQVMDNARRVREGSFPRWQAGTSISDAGRND